MSLAEIVEGLTAGEMAGFILEFSLNQFQNNTIYLYFTCFPD